MEDIGWIYNNYINLIEKNAKGILYSFKISFSRRLKIYIKSSSVIYDN